MCTNATFSMHCAMVATFMELPTHLDIFDCHQTSVNFSVNYTYCLNLIQMYDEHRY